MHRIRELIEAQGYQVIYGATPGRSQLGYKHHLTRRLQQVADPICRSWATISPH